MQHSITRHAQKGELRSMDLVDTTRLFLSLGFVLGLIGIFAWGAKRFGLVERLQNTSLGGKRLQILETLQLDQRHRVVLLKRDHAEHVILIGPNAETVLESNIAPRASNGELSVVEGDPLEGVRP
jgi:flagellar protein FliO/FliZ